MSPDNETTQARTSRIINMQTLRRVVQSLFLLWFVYLFLAAIGHYDAASGELRPISATAPVDFFLRIDPLIGATAMIAARKVIYISLVYALPIVALTVLFGRFFCGWICPLGTILDASDPLLRRKRKKTLPDKRFVNIKYYVLAFVAVTAVFSAQLAYLFDPISLLTRTFTFVIIAPAQMAISSLFPDLATNRYMPETQLFYRMNLIAFLMFAAIIAADKLGRRFWCRNLCPLGAMLALLSRFSFMRRIVSGSCNHCTLCARECKMAAILENPKEYNAPECIYCYTCTRVCKPLATVIRPGFASHGYTAGYDINRRRALQSVALGLVWVAGVKTHVSAKRSRDSEIKTSSPVLIRPPGAMAEEEFLATCTRCSECMKICPTNGLQPALLEAGLEGIWTPILIPRIGECTQKCDLCHRVCPTQAIQPFTVDEKTHIYIGTAVIDRSQCWVWNSDKPCLVCDEVCSYNAIDWKEVDGVNRPFVNEKTCTGCGICEQHCPIQPDSAIRAFSFGDKRHWSREAQKRYRGTAMSDE
ncbi:MAG: 4Fe-4S binding protein [Armatimonadota bacterium]|nr:4Fe-4S binding protein [Armatimonadota bacterium]